jgi:hypothetical protein
MLMIVLDATIVNVALPSIQDSLDFSQSNLAWVVNAYLIPFGGLLLLAGRMGDLLGQRRVFLTGLAIFTVASLVCAASESQEMLIGARFVQGIGGALASAVILGMIVTMFPAPAEQAKAIGVYGFVASAGGLDRPARRRGPDPGDQLALDLPDQPADRHRHRLRRPAPGRGPRGDRSQSRRRHPRGGADHRFADDRRLHDPRHRRARLGLEPRRSSSSLVSFVLGAVFILRQARIENPLMPLRLFPLAQRSRSERDPVRCWSPACSACSSSARCTCSGSSSTTRSR